MANSRSARSRRSGNDCSAARPSTSPGLACPGTHNTGVALVEVTQKDGPRLIVNNEEERFSGNKHTNEFPQYALDDMRKVLQRMGRDIGDIVAFVTTWDYPALMAMLIRTSFEEAPASLKLLRAPIAAGDQPAPDGPGATHLAQAREDVRARRTAAADLHAASRQSRLVLVHGIAVRRRPRASVAIAVLDGTGDVGSISLYVVENGEMKQLYCNESLFDSLGAFYTVISSSQGGWTWLSSEGRYMGAAAWGDMNRATNPYYARLKACAAARGQRHRAAQSRDGQLVCRSRRQSLQAAADRYPRASRCGRTNSGIPTQCCASRTSTTAPTPRTALDKAAATQLVFEDAMIHVIDHLLRITGTNRLVLTGGVALNALGNMRLLEHFDEAWFEQAQQRKTRLHMWVPPVPGDPGVPIGAAWLFAHHGRGAARRAAVARILLRPAAGDATTSPRRSQTDDVASTA